MCRRDDLVTLTARAREADVWGGASVIPPQHRAFSTLPHIPAPRPPLSTLAWCSVWALLALALVMIVVGTLALNNMLAPS